MKIIICLLVIAGFVGATEMVDTFDDRSVASSIEDILKSVQEQMPCGFPKFGIPPVAPLVIDRHDMNIDTRAFGLKGTFHNFSLNNLNLFDVIEVKLNVIKSRCTIRLNFKNVNVDTGYDLKLFLQKLGLTINMIGAGHAKFEIKNFEVLVTVKYSVGIISNKLTLKSLDFRIRMGNVVCNIHGVLGDGLLTRKMNEMVDRAFPMVVNDNEDLIAKNVENQVLPIVNNFLSGYRLDELLAIIGGSSGGTEPVKCEP